uniref:Dockerin domain-containing protein n=1 Tax=Ignavibacterium album TaxID=591197 RepID=A0A832DNC3_9BACT
MNIYVSTALADSINLTAGDEIGIFDGSICVGSKVLTSPINPNNPVSIIASADDPLTPQKDGFTPGNQIKFKLWLAGESKEIFNCLSDFQIGSGNFAAQGTALVSLNGFSVLKLFPLRVLIEGMFDGYKMTPDSIQIELRRSSSPYDVLDQVKVISDSNGFATADFDSIKLGEEFYIAIKHRNALETWSKLPQVFTSNLLAYNFTSDSTQAYGNNMTMKNGLWCLYSGDVNQDGRIDSTDLNIVFNDNVNGITGYFSTDLNGDGFVEIEDIIIIFNHHLNEIIKTTPE